MGFLPQREYNDAEFTTLNLLLIGKFGALWHIFFINSNTRRFTNSTFILLLIQTYFFQGVRRAEAKNIALPYCVCLKIYFIIARQ